MTETKKQAPRYYVGAVGEDWEGDLESFENLSEAIKAGIKTRLGPDYCGQKVFVAKEIGYRLIPDEETGVSNVFPIGDIESNQPYYLISRNGMSPQREGHHSVVAGKNLSKLLAKNGLPELNDRKRLAHGLDLRLRLK